MSTPTTPAKFTDLDLMEVGHSLQMVGVAYASKDAAYLCLLPEDGGMYSDVPLGARFLLPMSTGEWETFFHQADLLETPVWMKGADGTLAKIIARKSQRQIDQSVAWKVFRRDGYICRYCGKDDVPLTVDHLICWEDGGPTTTENLLAACRRCNQTRGRLSYVDWLKTPAYRKSSRNLSEETKKANAQLALTLDAIPRSFHTRTR